jgi:ABC-type nitrate/sulfonate/bicarbonate transport system substrate-binding protein
MGFFRREGLDVEIQHGLNSAESIAVLASGKSDATLSSLNTALVNAIVRGSRMRIVGAREQLTPGCRDTSMLWGLKKSFPDGFHSIRQLKGKRLSMDMPTSTQSFFLEYLLEREHMSPSDLTVEYRRGTESALALAAGKIDAAFTADLLRGQLSKDVIRGPSFGLFFPGFQVAFVVFGGKLLDAPEIGARFLKAYLEGAREFRSGKTPKFLEDFAREYNLGENFARDFCRESQTKSLVIKLEDLQQYIDWGVARKYIPRPVRADELVDGRALQALARLQGRNS